MDLWGQSQYMSLYYEPFTVVADSIAFREGVNEGKQIGYDNGFKEGEKVGKAVGYNNGKRDGEEIGFNKGKEVGYSLGKMESSSLYDLITAVYDGMTLTFYNIFNFELLGINVAGFIASLITLVILIFVIKLVV